MDHLLSSSDKPFLASRPERRKHPREHCSIKADYMVKGLWHRGFIQNISDGGAYILSGRGEQFSAGEKIFLVARIRVLRDQIRGKIAWRGSDGMGIEFKATELSGLIGVSDPYQRCQ